MNLLDILDRRPTPLPWSEADGIPWNDPDFSRRMLKEHLSQAHDAATRRLTVVEAHLDWIHQVLLQGRPSRVLDLGCGPGFYTTGLARRGHRCRGIDFSPASVEHACNLAREHGLEAEHLLGDIRTTPYGEGYDLVMLIYGEMNVFPSPQMAQILRGCAAALKPGGLLYLEASTVASLKRERDGRVRTWWHQKEGLFSDSAHLCLQESWWDEATQTATDRYYVIDAATAAVTRYASSYQGYPDSGYHALLAEAGFGAIDLALPFGRPSEEFVGITARR